jgi:hypothetical protein
VSQPEGRKDGYTEEGYKKVALNATLPNPQQKGRAVKRVHGFVHGTQDFGTAVKISTMTKAMDDQQPFDHPM